MISVRGVGPFILLVATSIPNATSWTCPCLGEYCGWPNGSGRWMKIDNKLVCGKCKAGEYWNRDNRECQQCSGYYTNSKSSVRSTCKDEMELHEINIETNVLSHTAGPIVGKEILGNATNNDRYVAKSDASSGPGSSVNTAVFSESYGKDVPTLRAKAKKRARKRKGVRKRKRRKRKGRRHRPRKKRERQSQGLIKPVRHD